MPLKLKISIGGVSVSERPIDRSEDVSVTTSATSTGNHRLIKSKRKISGPDKANTKERIKKQRKSKKSKKKSRTPSGMIRKTINKSGCFISIPHGFNFPITPTRDKTPPKAVQCSVPGCSNTKRYSCSKTGRPLCSLKCYRTNLGSASFNPPVSN